MLAIDNPNMPASYKYALDVIQVTVKDHFDSLADDEEADYELLKENLLNNLEKNQPKLGRQQASTLSGVDGQSVDKAGRKMLVQRDAT